MKYRTDSIDIVRQYPSREEEKENFEKRAKDISVDFLAAVRKHVISRLEYQLGANAISSLKIQWVMAVPAVWSPEAKNATKECAEAAGMGSRDELLMTSGPEAAASWALKKIQPNHLRVGNNIIILDAGEGMVDLVAYKIKRLEPTLQVEESGISTSGKCGGMFVDLIFEQLIDTKLAWAGMTIPETGRFEMRKHFELFVSAHYFEGIRLKLILRKD
jgi:hypothetical protein